MEQPDTSEGFELKQPSIRQSRIGHLFMVGLPGPNLDDETRFLIREKGICNFILFRKNVVNPEQLHNLCHELSCLCAREDLPPPLIAIDQEGGTVSRLPPPFSQFLDARVLADSLDPHSELTSYARTCAAELREIGINMNLAPVLDVCPAEPEYFMKRRCLGSDPLRVAHLGSLVIREMQRCGVAACAKHFPGLGAATLDPHHDLPVVNRSLEGLLNLDIVPFQEAINADVAAIMTSHTVYMGFDADNPATVSFRILTDLLRDKLRFQGVIITDDLEMGAIEKNGHVADAALASLKAGADLLLICHMQEKAHKALHIMNDSLRQGLVANERILASIKRLEKLRATYARPPKTRATTVSLSHKPPCSSFPLDIR